MARDNLVKAGRLEYVDLRLGDATEVIRTLPGPFDLVFFDADRTTAPDQLLLLLAKLSPRALILAENALSLQHVIVPVGKGLSAAFSAPT